MSVVEILGIMLLVTLTRIYWLMESAMATSGAISALTLAIVRVEDLMASWLLVLSCHIVSRRVLLSGFRLCALRQAPLLSLRVWFLSLLLTLHVVVMTLVVSPVLQIAVAFWPVLFSPMPQWLGPVFLFLLLMLALLFRMQVCIPQVRPSCLHVILWSPVAQYDIVRVSVAVLRLKVVGVLLLLQVDCQVWHLFNHLVRPS